MRMRKKIQHGFSLISAIFLLVVIAALGTFAVTLSTNQHSTMALDMLGARAYQAARAGIEWGAFQVLPNSAGVFASDCRTNGTNSQTFDPASNPLADTLAGFTVLVQCAATSHVENGNAMWVYHLTATSSQGTAGTPNYVERQISATITK